MSVLIGNHNRTGEPQKFTRPVGKLDPVTEAELRNVLTGGKEVPPNVDWVACPLAGSGTGLVEARLINGIVQFRGTLKVNASAVGSTVKVRHVNEAVPPPSLELHAAAFAIDTGTAYRIGLVRITPSRSIEVSAPTGKFDAIQFDGISYPVF